MSDILKSNWKYTLYPLSFLIPLFGIIYGLIQLLSYDEKIRKWGKIQIILGILGVATYCSISITILIRILR